MITRLDGQTAKIDCRRFDGRTAFGQTQTCPILLIGFNRPDFMAAQIAVLRHAKPGRLYIAVDGPRIDRSGEENLCRRVRDCVNLVDWPCEVKTLFREKNLGCKYGVSGAIAWFFENETEGIVLEDDCRPTLDFLRFATEMLARYRDDVRIGAVCGFNFFNLQSDKSASYHFSRHMDVWGWASWRRVWKDYDVDVTKNEERLFAMIDESNATPYYKKFYKSLVRSIENGLSTWDTQLSLLFMEKGYLSVVPRVRLVANVGLIDSRATHTGGYVYWAREWSKVGVLDDVGSYSPQVVCDEEADRLRERMEGAILPRGLTWLGAKLPPLCGILSAIGTLLQKTMPWLFRI